MGPTPNPTAEQCDTSGCCSQDFASCGVSWCGTTKNECLACGFAWICGEQTGCLGRWGDCTANEDGCCNGLACVSISTGYSQCQIAPPTPKPSSSRPTAKPTSTPTEFRLPTTSSPTFSLSPTYAPVIGGPPPCLSEFKECTGGSSCCEGYKCVQVHPALHRPKAIHPLVNQQSAVVLGTLGRAPILITHSVMPTRRIARVHAARSGSPVATYRIPAFHSGRKDVQLIQIVACGVTVTRKAFVIMMVRGSHQ